MEGQQNYGGFHESVGQPVVYVDEHAVAHQALVTAVWAIDGTLGECSVNLVYVSGDDTQSDPYGRQIARATSVVQKSAQSAHGRYYFVS